MQAYFATLKATKSARVGEENPTKDHSMSSSHAKHDLSRKSLMTASRPARCRKETGDLVTNKRKLTTPLVPPTVQTWPLLLLSPWQLTQIHHGNREGCRKKNLLIAQQACWRAKQYRQARTNEEVVSRHDYVPGCLPIHGQHKSRRAKTGPWMGLKCKNSGAELKCCRLKWWLGHLHHFWTRSLHKHCQNAERLTHFYIPLQLPSP